MKNICHRKSNLQNPISTPPKRTHPRCNYPTTNRIQQKKNPPGSCLTCLLLSIHKVFLKNKFLLCQHIRPPPKPTHRQPNKQVYFFQTIDTNPSNSSQQAIQATATNPSCQANSKLPSLLHHWSRHLVLDLPYHPLFRRKALDLNWWWVLLSGFLRFFFFFSI